VLIAGLSFGERWTVAQSSTIRANRKNRSRRLAGQDANGYLRAAGGFGYAEDEAAQRELSDLARELHNAYPVRTRNFRLCGQEHHECLGRRAALALGYDDYAKSRAAQGLGCIESAEHTLLREYALYWTPKRRAMGATRTLTKVLQTFQQDYPNTAARGAAGGLAPTAVQLGHAQELSLRWRPIRNTSKPRFFMNAPTLIRQHINSRGPRKTISSFYKYRLQTKPTAGSALTQLMHDWGRIRVSRRGIAGATSPGVLRRAQMERGAQEYEKLLTC